MSRESRETREVEMYNFATRTGRSLILAAFAGYFVTWVCGTATAQVAVQLPTFNVFSVQTTVMVPDGGRMNLGSIGGSSQGMTSRGVPLLGSAPGFGRPFNNRAMGSSTSSANVSVTAQIISLSELEAPLLSEGNRRLASRPFATPADVQRRAAYLSRNMGRVAEGASATGAAIRR